MKMWSRKCDLWRLLSLFVLLGVLLRPRLLVLGRRDMNWYAMIILAALLLDLALELLGDALNLRALKDELPAEFDGVYDPADYRKSQEYLRVNTRFGHVSTVFDLVVMLVFWFGHGFSWLDRWCRSWEWHPVASGIAFIGILMLAKTVLDLPFRYYGTFVIEERFGFNKTTLKTFVLDGIKGLLLSLFLGVPLLAAVLSLFQYGGSQAWLYCWLAVTGFTLLLQYIAPTWIMPLFNKFTPMEEGELREAIHDFARKVKFPLQGLYVIDGSRRSSKGNAFFTGFGKNKRIALFDTLVAQHSVSELVGVLAHEIGHFKKRHILKGLLLGVAHTGVIFFLLSVFLTHQGLFEAFYLDQRSVYAGLIFFGMLYAPVEMLLALFVNWRSRCHEFEADRFAAENLDDPESLVAALKKLSVKNLANLTPHPFFVALNYSHPPVLARIKALREASRRGA
jgi:STE24 endopeptidase